FVGGEFGSVGVLGTASTQLIARSNLLERADLGVIELDRVGRIAADDSVVCQPDSDGLVAGSSDGGDSDRFCGGVDGLDETTDAAALPILKILLLFLRDVGFLHRDERACGKRLGGVVGLSPNKNAITGLKVLKCKRRCFLQVLA